jgi:hypothetical protein
MIKLKNLWKIALATMTMSAMLVACDTTSDGGSTEKEVKTTQKSETGVYSYTVDIEKISNAWGGSKESPAFSILLLTDANVKAAAKKNDLKASPLTAPEYQVAAFGNVKIKSTKEAGDFAVYGQTSVVNPADKTKDMYVYYDGVAATVTGTTVTVTVDMNKLTKTQLKALWNSGEGECTVGDADSDADVKEADVNLADYKPYVLALDGRYKDEAGNFVEVDSENKVMAAWNADLMVMQPATALPANLTKNAPAEAPNCNALTSIAGTMTSANWDHLPLKDKKFTFTAAEKNEFKLSNGTWDYAVGAPEKAQITTLGTEFKLEEGANPANITFKNGVLTAGKEYVIELIVKDGHDAYVKVTAK